MIRLVHVEPNTVMRVVLKDMLDLDDLEVVASVAYLSDLPAARAAALAPDILLIAPGEGPNSLEALHRWRDAVPGTKVLVLLADCAPERVLPILQAGIEGVLLTEQGTEAMARAIALVAMGQRVIPPRLATLLQPMEPGAACADRFRPSGLTSIECIVLGHLRAGLSNHSIAVSTGQDEPDVKVQIHSIFRKLKVRNRTQAALWAVRNSHLLLSFGGSDAAGIRRSG